MNSAQAPAPVVQTMGTVPAGAALACGALARAMLQSCSGTARAWAPARLPAHGG